VAIVVIVWRRHCQTPGGQTAFSSFTSAILYCLLANWLKGTGDDSKRVLTGLLLDRYRGGRPGRHGVLRAPELGHGLHLCEEIKSLTTVEVDLAQKRRSRTGERKHWQRNWNWDIHSNLRHQHIQIG